MTNAAPALAMETAQTPRIVLHLGAHKTASTHFARTLRRSEAAVKHFSLSVPEKQRVRDLLTRRIPQVRPSEPLADDLLDVAAKLTDDRDMAYLCEENVLGTTLRIFAEGQIYPRAERRLRRALHLLGDARVELMMAIRHPASFAVSSYGETVRFHGYRPFEDFMGSCGPENIRWAPLVRRLLRAANGRRMILWRFEDYTSLVPDLLCHVADTSRADAPMFRKLRRIVRPGLSQRAVEEIQSLCLGENAAPSAKQFEKIVRSFPKSEDWPPPNPWTAEQLSQMDANYAVDVAALRSMRNVEFFGPA